MTPILLILLLNSALLVGNEFAVAAFIHPSLSRQNQRSHLSAIQRFATLYGNIMPIWMGITTALHALVGVVAWRSASPAFPWLLGAAAIWIVTIPYSLLLPVPLNNEVKAWDLNNLPPDWEKIRSRWDTYNWIRVIFLMLAFVLLAEGFKVY